MHMTVFIIDSTELYHVGASPRLVRNGLAFSKNVNAEVEDAQFPGMVFSVMDEGIPLRDLQVRKRYMG